jgi:hypothetical protein
VAWSRQNLQSVERGSPPQPGDIVHFTWSMSEWPPTRPGTGDHVGLVESWNGADTLTTIEGNVGSPQGVYRMRRSINATLINYWRPVGIYTDGTAPAPAPQPKEDDDMMHQYRDVSNGTVYVTWGMFKSPLEDDGVRQGLMTMGLLAPQDQYFEQNPGMLAEFVTVNQDIFANIAGSVNAGRKESADQTQAVIANGNAAAQAVMANSNKLAAGIATGGTPAPPVLDKAASLKLATVAELLNEISARTKGAAAL